MLVQHRNNEYTSNARATHRCEAIVVANVVAQAYQNLWYGTGVRRQVLARNLREVNAKVFVLHAPPL